MLENIFRFIEEKGLKPFDAAREATAERTLMTTLALVGGMLALALGTGPGAEERRTIAVVVIGGQSLSLFLTLVVIPAAYSLFDDLAVAVRSKRTLRPVVQPVEI